MYRYVIRMCALKATWRHCDVTWLQVNEHYSNGVIVKDREREREREKEYVCLCVCKSKHQKHQ